VFSKKKIVTISRHTPMCGSILGSHENTSHDPKVQPKHTPPGRWLLIQRVSQRSCVLMIYDPKKVTQFL